MDSSQSLPLHIVVFPWLAFGHLLPNLELAERLAARGHRVSFVSTPRNISRLRPVPPALAPLIDFVALPLPRVDGLPDGAEATSDIPPGKADLHLKALDGLAAPFAAFLDAACADGSTNKVDWLFVDSFQYWAAAAAAAADRKIPCALSLVFAASTSAEYGVPQAEALEEGSTATILQRFALTFEKCQLVIHRSCTELEPEQMPLLPGIFGKPVIPYGLVPPCAPAQGQLERGNAAMSWLDKQQPESVLYIALGSEPPVTVQQLHEIALGLELAGTPFLWALKKPNGLLLEADDGNILPPGFEERTRDRGLVGMGWVPQLSILAHSSVAAFLTHGGWSSTVEGAMFGHPMIFLTFLGEQKVNARLVESKKAGLRVPRDDKDGSFDRQGVAGAIRAVMCDEESKNYFVANAKKMQEIVNDSKCQERYIDELIQHLRSFGK